MHTLKAKYHTSDEKVEESIKTIANMLFGRKWKEYSPNQPTDNNNLPYLSNLRRTERYTEAMVLYPVAEEIMNNDTKSCVVYSNHGSGQSGVGNYVVQSLTINCVQSTLPTLPIASESKNMSLKDHRFNRLNNSCLTILYHLDDIARYLEKYSSITNGISILDRSFIDIEILKPIFAAISLLGIHILWPFHKLMMTHVRTTVHC